MSPGIRAILDVLSASGPLREYTSATGPGWMVRCPCHWNHTHGDRTSSARVWIGPVESTGPEILKFKCYRGCTRAEAQQAVGLPKSAWFVNPKGPGHRVETAVIAKYEYVSAEGEWLYTVAKTMTNGVRGFYQFRPIPELPTDHVAMGMEAGWYEMYRQVADRREYKPVRDKMGRISGSGPPPHAKAVWVPSVERVLYRLDEVYHSPPDVPVIVTEGEKDCDKVRDLGHVCTTLPGGANKSFHTRMLAPLAGRHVLVHVDHNEVGYQHMRQVMGGLLLVGAASVTPLPWQPGEAHDNMDITDWLLRIEDEDQRPAKYRERFLSCPGYYPQLPRSDSHARE